MNIQWQEKSAIKNLLENCWYVFLIDNEPKLFLYKDKTFFDQNFDDCGIEFFEDVTDVIFLGC